MFEFKFDFDSEISNESEKIKVLEQRIKELEEKLEKYKIAEEIDLFDKNRVNGRHNIYVLQEWIGHAMFIQGGKFEKFENGKKQIYREVWKECVLPMLKEFAGLKGL